MAIAALVAVLPLKAPAQDAVFLIRHAEKDAGDDPGLTGAGRARAAQWAEMLAHAGIAQVYTSTAKRTIETGEIIADALGVDLEAVETGDTAGLLDLISFDHETSRVLVVGHVETIPGIVMALGYPDPLPMTQDDFDRLFLVVPRDGDTAFIEMAMP